MAAPGGRAGPSSSELVRAVEDTLRREVHSMSEILVKALREEWQSQRSQPSVACCKCGTYVDDKVKRNGSKPHPERHVEPPPDLRPPMPFVPPLPASRGDKRTSSQPSRPAPVKTASPAKMLALPGQIGSTSTAVEETVVEPKSPLSPTLEVQSPSTSGTSSSFNAGAVVPASQVPHTVKALQAWEVHEAPTVVAAFTSPVPHAPAASKMGADSSSGLSDDDEEDSIDCLGLPAPTKQDGLGDLELSEALQDAPRRSILAEPKDQWQFFRLLDTMISSNYFDYFVCSAIITNAIVIGVNADFNLQIAAAGSASHSNPAVFKFFETLFAIVFTAELSLRILLYRLSFFWQADWRWNIFDTVIVTMQLVDISLELVVGGDSQMPSNFNFMRILRVLRLVRIIRLVRVLRYFQDLRTMVSSIASSCKSLLWTIILVALLIYVVGVYLTNLIADHGIAHPDTLKGEAYVMYYNSLLRTTLSLFQAMTGGIDWNDLMQPLVDEISPLLAIVYSFYITFSVLCMMNVITGVFVESALMTARADKDKDMRRQVELAFVSTDCDNSGKISWKEFTDAVNDDKIVDVLKGIDIDPSEAKGLFALLDTDGSGDINLEEFVSGCLRLRGQARAIDLATLMYYNKRVSAWWVQRLSSIEASLEELAEGLAKARPPETTPSFQSLGELRVSTGTSPRIKTGDVHFGATWADLKAEGDRRVAEIHKQRTKERAASGIGVSEADDTTPGASGTSSPRRRSMLQNLSASTSKSLPTNLLRRRSIS